MAQLLDRVLVTGATGFVGAWLCRRLVDNAQSVTGLVRNLPGDDSLFERLDLVGNVALLRLGDRGLADVVSELAPTLVVNLAGCSQVGAARADPAAAFRANTAFTWELLDALRLIDRPPTFVQASTEAVYGAGSGVPFQEPDPLAPLGPYAASKAAAEIVVRSYGATYGIPVVILRFGNIYGAGDPNQARLVPDLTRAFAEGRPPQLRDGRSVRTYLHIDDAVDAIIDLAMHAGRDDVRGEVFNVAGDRPYTNLDVAHLAREASGRDDISIVVGDTPNSSMQLASTDKIRKTIDWNPRIGLAQGLYQVASEEVLR